MSIPEVDNCRSDWGFSIGGVRAAPVSVLPSPLEGGDGIDGRAGTAALGGRDEGGSVVFDRGERPIFGVVVDLVLRTLFGDALVGGGAVGGGVSLTGDSCGERSELMSMFTACRDVH